MNAPGSFCQPRSEKVVAQETGAGLYQVRANAAGLTFLVDEPAEVGGLGTGPNPYDLLGAALAACTVMTVRLYADRKAWPVEHVAVRVEHHPKTHAAQDRFELDLMLEGALSDTHRERLLEIANRCPVHLTLSGGADVRTALRGPIVDEGSGPPHSLHHAHMAQSCSDAIAPIARLSITS